MIDRLSEPDPPRTVAGEIVNILSVSGRPVTINGMVGRVKVGTKAEVVNTLAALVKSGEVKLIEVHGRHDCLVLSEETAAIERKKSKRTAKSHTFDRIMAFLADGPKTRAEVATHLQASKTNVTNFAREMEIEGLVERLPAIKLPGSSQPQVLIRIKEKKDE